MIVVEGWESIKYSERIKGYNKNQITGMNQGYLNRSFGKK